MGIIAVVGIFFMYLLACIAINPDKFLEAVRLQESFEVRVDREVCRRNPDDEALRKRMKCDQFKRRFVARGERPQ